MGLKSDVSFISLGPYQSLNSTVGRAMIGEILWLGPSPAPRSSELKYFKMCPHGRKLKFLCNLVTEEFLGKIGKTEEFAHYIHPWKRIIILF